MRSKRYTTSGAYRGRRRGSAVLKALIFMLAVLLLVGVISVLLLGNYIEYTDDGVRLILPWTQEQEREENIQPEPSQDLVISEEPVIPEEPQPEPVAVPPGAVEVPVSAVLDGSAAGLAEGNAIVVTVKDLEGHLAWRSSSPYVNEVKGGDGTVLNGDPAFSEAVRSLSEQEDVYLVARVKCFCDLWMCVHDRSMILSTPAGKIWYDTKGMPWLSPANGDAAEYISGLCLELAEMGFDEILLECAGFPESGRLSAVAVNENYPSEDLAGAVAKWLDGLIGRLSGSDTVVSVLAGRKDLDECPSGRTAELLAGVRRVWVGEDQEAERWKQALKEAGVEDSEERVVRILSGDEERPASGWALLED